MENFLHEEGHPCIVTNNTIIIMYEDYVACSFNTSIMHTFEDGKHLEGNSCSFTSWLDRLKTFREFLLGP